MGPIFIYVTTQQLTIITDKTAPTFIAAIEPYKLYL